MAVMSSVEDLEQMFNLLDKSLTLYLDCVTPLRSLGAVDSLQIGAGIQMNKIFQFPSGTPMVRWHWFARAGVSTVALRGSSGEYWEQDI